MIEQHKMIRFGLTLALLLGLTCKALGSEDSFALWDEVIVKAPVHNIPAVVRAQVKEEKLTSLNVELAGKLIAVPIAELQDIEKPRLHSLQLLYGVYRNVPGRKALPEDMRDKPYFYVQLLFGDPIGTKRKQEDGRYSGDFHMARFLFRDGDYQERQTRKIISAKEWNWEKKLPGQPPESIGTERLLE